MVAAAWGGAQDADLTLFILDARAGLTDPVRAIAARLARGGGRRPVWLVLNKVDLVPPPRLLPLAAEANALVPVAETFMVSAETGSGLDRLLDRLAEAMPPGPWLFPEDELTDLPNRMLAAEIVREQVLRQTHEEVPHHATVETEQWTERPDGSVRVDCTIYVSRPTQKAILIGDGGARIREIGRRARIELAKLLDRPVHLFLNVKDRPGWDEERGRLRALGLEDEG
jgi:GTP-binding protein Era